jgi:hypothetical protein
MSRKAVEGEFICPERRILPTGRQKGGLMAKSGWVVAGLIAVAFAWPGTALPQTVSPEAVAAAKELMVAAKVTDQINLMLPHIMQQLKPLIVKGNPELDRDFDALMPAIKASMNTQLEAFLNDAAQIYARHFTADEIRQVTSFYRTPTGEKFLQKQPEVVQETFARADVFGKAVAADLQNRIVDELRKRGHKI